jgi:hypothetical protein
MYEIKLNRPTADAIIEAMSRWKRWYPHMYRWLVDYINSLVEQSECKASEDGELSQSAVDKILQWVEKESWVTSEDNDGEVTISFEEFEILLNSLVSKDLPEAMTLQEMKDRFFPNTTIEELRTQASLVHCLVGEEEYCPHAPLEPGEICFCGRPVKPEIEEDEFEAIGFCKTCSHFKQEPEWEPLGKCVFYSSVPPTSNGFACEEYELDDEYAWLDKPKG